MYHQVTWNISKCWLFASLLFDCCCWCCDVAKESLLSSEPKERSLLHLFECCFKCHDQLWMMEIQGHISCHARIFCSSCGVDAPRVDCVFTSKCLSKIMFLWQKCCKKAKQVGGGQQMPWTAGPHRSWKSTTNVITSRAFVNLGFQESVGFLASRARFSLHALFARCF